MAAAAWGRLARDLNRLEAEFALKFVQGRQARAVRYLRRWPEDDPMQGKTVVITGATSGIGQVAAEALATLGARIVFTARDASKASATLARVKGVGPAAQHDWL